MRHVMLLLLLTHCELPLNGTGLSYDPASDSLTDAGDDSEDAQKDAPPMKAGMPIKLGTPATCAGGIASTGPTSGLVYYRTLSNGLDGGIPCEEVQAPVNCEGNYDCTCLNAQSCTCVDNPGDALLLVCP